MNDNLGIRIPFGKVKQKKYADQLCRAFFLVCCFAVVPLNIHVYFFLRPPGETWMPPRGLTS